MKKIGKTTILLGLLAAGGLWFAQGDDSDHAEGAASSHLVNQLWVERWPEGHRDIFGKLMVLKTEHGRVGVVGKSSNWRHFYEAFLWAKEGDELRMAFPQEGHRARFNVRTWKCEGDAPDPFELCLEIRRGDRHVRFYSKNEWEIRPEHSEEDLAAIVTEHPWLGDLEVPSSLPEVDTEALNDASGDWTPFR